MSYVEVIGKPVPDRKTRAEKLLASLADLIPAPKKEQQQQQPQQQQQQDQGGGFSPVLTAKQLVTHQQAHPLALDHLMYKLYGELWYTWEPETVWRELELTFGTEPADLTKSKLQALRTLAANKMFWAVWEVFAPVCQALNNRLAAPQVFVKPTVPQIYFAVEVAQTFDRFPFSQEVSRFIAEVFFDDGLTYALPPLDFINDELQLPRYRCLDCGNDEIDEHNRVCDNCGSQNIEHYHQVPVTEEQRLAINKMVSGDWSGPIPETREGVMAAKLKVATGYLTQRRLQLRHQLRLIDDWLER